MNKLSSYERYRKQALWAYDGKPAPNVDQIAYNATVGKKFGRLTEEEYNDVMHICMACTIPNIEYDRERKVAIEYFESMTLEYGVTKL